MTYQPQPVRTMFHYMFSLTFKLVQPQFVPIHIVGLFPPRAMASSSPTTKNRFFFNFFTMYIMRIFYYIEPWPYCHQHLFPILNRHLYPAQTYGTNLKASDQSTLTRPMHLLMLHTFLRLTTLTMKLLWMNCWNLLFLNHINMLLLHHRMPFQIHQSSQPRHQHLQNANRRPKQLPKHPRNAVDLMTSRDPVLRAL